MRWIYRASPICLMSWIITVHLVTSSSDDLLRYLATVVVSGRSSGGSNPKVQRVGPGGGAVPADVVVLEEIGLLVAERDGQVRMVGRIDQRYPAALLDGGIWPPAIVVAIDGEPVESTDAMRASFDAIGNGSPFTFTFEHQGRTLHFELTK